VHNKADGSYAGASNGLGSTLSLGVAPKVSAAAAAAAAQGGSAAAGAAAGAPPAGALLLVQAMAGGFATWSYTSAARAAALRAPAP
jgi:hypothetical protein